MPAIDQITVTDDTAAVDTVTVLIPGVQGPTGAAVGDGGQSLSYADDGTATFSEGPVAFPGLDPTDRTERSSDGWVSIFAPGYAAGAVELRRQVAVYEANQATAGTRNSCLFEGWNYAAGSAQIDATLGSIGWGIEHSYNPQGSQVWSEYHCRFTPPGGGAEYRPISFYGEWTPTPGTTGLSLFGSTVSIGYMAAGTGVRTPIFTFGPSACSVTDGATFYFLTKPGGTPYKQLNSAGDAYLNLPCWAPVGGFMDIVVAGFDPAFPTLWRPLQAQEFWQRPRVFSDVPTPPDGAIQYWDSATGQPLWKKADGTAVTAAGAVVH